MIVSYYQSSKISCPTLYEFEDIEEKQEQDFFISLSR